MGGHCVVGEIVDHPKLLIQEMSDVRVKPVHQREAVVFPGVILDAEKGPLTKRAFSAKPCSFFIFKIR